jgi:glycosyltransferase involved in cell wall biosynthesis
MKIIFTAGRELTYPRNSQNIRALKKEYDVHLVTSPASRLTTRLIKVGWQLLRRKFTADEICFIGFFGQPLVFPVRLNHRGPIILDAFVSTYDTLCLDRKVFNPRSIQGQMTFHLDRLSCQMVNTIIVDTKAQAEYFENTFGVPGAKLRVVYVGCDDELFHPMTAVPSSTPSVLFYGTFLPVHGLEIIIEAARQMASENVSFHIIGRGQEYERIRKLANELQSSNVQFLDPIPLERLPEVIARSTICLGGHFGNSEKARRVIAGKTFQCLAMGRPTIVGDNPANHELFTHGKNVWMCPMNEPSALADAIRHLLESPQLRAQLGQEGREIVQRTSGNAMTAQSLRDIIETTRASYGRPSNDS